MKIVLTKILEDVSKKRDILFNQCQVALEYDDFEKFEVITKYLAKLDKLYVRLIRFRRLWR